MKNIKIIIFSSLFLISFIGILTYKKNMYVFTYPDKVLANFNFIAKLNSSEYVLNTYNNTFSKGLTWEKDTIINFKISNEEKIRIYNLMKEINIVEYPNYYAPPTHIRVSPSFDFYFKCSFEAINIEINWEFNIESEIEKAVKLRKFLHSIFENILNDPKIKNLPESERISM